MGLCHSIIYEDYQYLATSPDELALVNFAKMWGVEFKGKNALNKIFLEVFQEETKFELLHRLEFTSPRKRMSVILKDPNGKILLICKGADNEIFKRAKNSRILESLQKNVDTFAREGLRVLVIGKKELSNEEYIEFDQKMRDAKRELNINKKLIIEQIQDEIENDLTIIGATGIEDLLQDEIKNTIKVKI